MREKPKILVVEDQRITAEDVKETLEKLGYAVSGIAVTGETAIDIVEKEAPDLVLMDIVLKGEKDGIETANYLRSHFNIPVIYLTAYTDQKMLERAKLTEPSGYLVKPFKEKDLYSVIEITLHKSQTRQNTPGKETVSPIQQKLLSQIQKISLLPPGKEKKQLFQAMNELEQRLEKVLYLQAKGHTCHLVLDSAQESSFDLRISLHQLEPYCKDHLFLKIHRSYLIIPERALYITKKTTRDYELWLKEYSHHPISIPVGRSYLPQLRKIHPDWFIH